jgi:hypothetical protein
MTRNATVDSEICFKADEPEPARAMAGVHTSDPVSFTGTRPNDPSVPQTSGRWPYGPGSAIDSPYGAT